MTRRRKWPQVSHPPHTSDEQLETSQESTEPTLTPEAASQQHSHEEKDTTFEPEQMPWPCDYAELVYKERVRTNNDVFPTLHDSTAQIRLLRLDAESTADHITADLETWQRSSLPVFNAISYVCGEAFPQNAVYINGHAFYVGDNCFHALGQVCLHYPGSYVWIDAICINQQDLAEKSAQVAAMGSIYRSALNVLACIGPSDAASDAIARATKDLDSFVQDPPPEWDAADAYRKPHLWAPPLWKPPMDESATLKLWETFTEFELRPYFNRAWIVQELGGGGDGRTAILCGRSRMDWAAVCALADRLWAIHESWHAPYNLSERRSTQHRIHDFDRLMRIFRGAKHPFPGYMMCMLDKDCQDPRDRFFSTVGLVDWQRFGQTQPVPDYRLTPIELAFDLLQITAIPSLYDISYIPESLGLQYSAQVLSEIEKKRTSRESQYTARRQYDLRFSGVQVVYRSADGKLSVDLHRHDEGYTDSVPSDFDGPAYDPSFLSAHNLVRLFTRGKASVLASERVRVGDVLVRCWESIILMRCHEAQPRLLIVGAALLAGNYTSHDGSPPGCVCWGSVPRARDGHAIIGLRLVLPDEVALGSVIAQPGTFDSHDRGRVVSYLNRYAIGTAMAHSRVGSPLTSHTKGNHTLRSPPRRPCADCKKTGNPFWYLLNPDEAGIVSFGH